MATVGWLVFPSDINEGCGVEGGGFDVGVAGEEVVAAVVGCVG